MFHEVGENSQIEIWCGHSHAHNNLWGSSSTDKKGKVIEDMMDGRLLVGLNNGSGTRMNTVSNVIANLDLTFVSASSARSSE